VRVAVAKALGERGNIGTVPKLMPLLTDEHHGVRYMAAASIVRLSTKSQDRASIKPR
jgi:HEAT repeat protein